MNSWRIRESPVYQEQQSRIHNMKILDEIEKAKALLQRSPDAGKQLKPPSSHLYEIRVDGYRLYYTLKERKREIELVALYPRALQGRFLRG